MIIWMASYPKSGNTWIRSFLTTLLYSHTGENDFANLNKIRQFPAKSQFSKLLKDNENINEISENWINAQNIINLDKKIKLYKTHHVNCKIGQKAFTDSDNSLGVIHIVRDPRNVVTSIKNHYSLSNIEMAKKFIFDENMWIGFKNKSHLEKDNKFPTLISSWKTNYISWKNSTKNYFLVKYEDLIKDPNKNFHRIAEYISKLMNLNFEKEKIEKAILSNSFDSLKKLEKKGVFKEHAFSDKIGKKINFFHLGPENKWEKLVDKNIVNEIEKKFEPEMKELNYL